MRLPRIPRLDVSVSPIRWQSLALVIAGVAVGMLAHQMARPGLAMMATCISCAAFLAVLTLGTLEKKRREVVCREKLEGAMTRLQSRLERHCPRVPKPHARRAFGTLRADRQYLTVVGRAGNYVR